MKQYVLHSERLAAQIEAAIKRRRVSYAKFAKFSGVDASRVSRFCNGDFKRATPVLQKLCKKLEIPLESFAVDFPSSDWKIDISRSLHRLVKKNHHKMRTITKLIHSIEQLVEN